MGSVVKAVTKPVSKVVKAVAKPVKKVTKAVVSAPKKVVAEVKRAPTNTVKLAKKVTKTAANAPSAALNYTVLKPAEMVAGTVGNSLGAVAPGLNAAMPAIAQGASLYATGGLSGGLMSGLSGGGMGKMNFFDDLLGSAGDALKGSGLDVLNGLLGQNGNSPGSATVPAETIIRQTDKAVKASQNQTESMIAGMNSKMMMMIGGAVSLFAIVYLMTKKRK